MVQSEEEAVRDRARCLLGCLAQAQGETVMGTQRALILEKGAAVDAPQIQLVASQDYRGENPQQHAA